jgi:hypothetical protein
MRLFTSNPAPAIEAADLANVNPLYHQDINLPDRLGQSHTPLVILSAAKDLSIPASLEGFFGKKTPQNDIYVAISYDG